MAAVAVLGTTPMNVPETTTVAVPETTYVPTVVLAEEQSNSMTLAIIIIAAIGGLAILVVCAAFVIRPRAKVAIAPKASPEPDEEAPAKIPITAPAAQTTPEDSPA
eukprot:497376-Rhodomonas_salina.2